jgi:hypothetical protein
MADTDNKDPKEPQSADLPGLSSHFSTTLTGLKPTRRRSKATTSVEMAPPPVEAKPAAAPEPPPEPAPAPEPVPQTAPEPVARPEPAPAAAEPVEARASRDSVSIDPDQIEMPMTDPLEGIELRPGLSLVDTAEIPIHRASAAAKLRAVRESEAPRLKPQQPPSRPAPPTPPPRSQAPSRMPSAFEETPRSARRESSYSNTNAYWLYGLVMVLIMALIAVFVLQVKDLF